MHRPTLTALLLAPLLAMTAARADAGDAVGWRLARSDFVGYDRTELDRAGGKEKVVRSGLVTVHGHDLRDGGQYAPASQRHGDLIDVLALRLPAADAARTAVKLDWRGLDTATIRVKGEIAVKAMTADTATIEGTYEFKQRGKVPRDARWSFDGGRATTQIQFDLTRGVIQAARLEITYEREDLKKNGPGAVVALDRAYRYTLASVERRRPSDLQERVNKAIDRGVAQLKSKQRADGTWKPHGDYRIGTTALAVFTLLACGVPADDAVIEKGLAWLFDQEPKRTYEQATCLMAVDRAFMPEEELEARRAGKPVRTFLRRLPPKRMAWARRIAEQLERNALGSGGSWGYPAKSTSSLRFDSSNTQYAVLGLRAALHLGHPVSERTWLGVIRHCLEVRERKAPKGRVSIIREGTAIPDERQAASLGVQRVPAVAGFAYATIDGHDHVNGSMTCAGITMLLIARHELLAMESRKLKPKVLKDVDAMIHGGWAWLDAHWAVDRNPMHPTERWYWYFLYSLERAAVLDSVKRLGGKDWYFEGAVQLLHRQGENGGWNDPGQDHTAPTCFALLFLKRGTTPLGAPLTGG